MKIRRIAKSELPSPQAEGRLHYGLRIEGQALKWLLENSGSHQRELLDRNYRWRGGEIDLVLLEDGQELVFVEVRAREKSGKEEAGLFWPDGLESLDHRKRRRLSRTIRHYLMGYRGSAKTLRFDLVAWDGRSWSHFRDLMLD